MDLTETIVGLGACAAILVLAVALDRRPYRVRQAQLHSADDHLPGSAPGAGAPPADLNSTGVNRARVVRTALLWRRLRCRL